MKTDLVYRFLSSYWLTIIAGLLVLMANWPRHGGLLFSQITDAGFPLVCVAWEDGKPVDFRPLAFAMDIVIGVGFLFVVTTAVTWSRKAMNRKGSAVDQ